MQITDLKKSIWGYNTNDVYYYVANLEKEIKHKYELKNKKLEKEILILKERIKELEKDKKLTFEK